MMNTQFMLNSLAQNQQVMQNPTAQTVMELYKKNDRQGLMELLNNTCQTMGVNIQQYLERFC